MFVRSQESTKYQGSTFSPWCAEQEPHTPAALKWHKGVWFWGSEQPQANTMTKGS